MSKLFFYELKKLFRNPWVWMAIIYAGLFFGKFIVTDFLMTRVTSEDDVGLFGEASDKRLEEIFPGKMTDESVRGDLNFLKQLDWETAEETEDYFTAFRSSEELKYFNDREWYFFKLLNLYSKYDKRIDNQSIYDGLKSLSLYADELPDFNIARREIWNREIENSFNNDTEKAYLKKLIDKPYPPTPYRGESGFSYLSNLDFSSRMPKLALGILIIIISFYDRINNTEKLFSTFSAKHKKRLSKILISIFLSLIVILAIISLFFIPTLLRHGYGSKDLPVQSIDILSFNHITNLQYAFLRLFMVSLGIILAGSFAYFLGNRIKYIGVSVLIYSAPFFILREIYAFHEEWLYFNFEGGKFLKLIPYFTAGNLNSLNCCSIFGIPVSSITATVMVHMVLIVFFLWAGSREKNSNLLFNDK